MKRSLLLGLLVLAAAFHARDAAAFCQATTCDPSDPTQHCELDAVTKCVLTGEPLYWASSCLTISVQSDAAPGVGINYAAARGSVERAFAAWTNARCDGGTPSIAIELSAPVECSTSEYSGDHRNANIVMFREDEWPYVGGEDALGLTRVRFDLEKAPGELWDADIEVNAVTEPLGVGTPGPSEVDLDSLLTHEAGHVLGLGHTLDVGATMGAGYSPGSTAQRTPEPDDVDGICSIYPPGRKASSSSCEPRHGFSGLCADEQPAELPPIEEPPSEEATSSSCALAGSRPGSSSRSGSGENAGALALLLGGSAFLRRRRAARSARLAPSHNLHQFVPCGPRHPRR